MHYNFKHEIKQIKMKIRKNVLAKVYGSADCKRRLMIALDISAPTMTRYLRDNDDNLTKVAALNVIGEYFNLPINEIIEEQEKTAA